MNYRSLVEDAKNYKRPDEVSNQESFWEMQKRLLGDFGNKAIGVLDPGIGLAADLGGALGRGDYGQAALDAPFMALTLAGGKAANMARSPFTLAKGIGTTGKLPEGVLPKPIKDIALARQDYMRRNFGPPRVATEISPFNAQRATNVAGAFDKLSDNIDAPGVRDSYQALADETLGQYRALKDRGINFKFMDRDPATGEIVDPYAANPALGYKDLAEKGQLEIFPTEGGFGTINPADRGHPMLQPSGERFGDKPAVVNDLFRAIHDAYGHFGPGNPRFRAPGEDAAFQLHGTMFSPDAIPVATTELRGQNSWLNYGPHGAHNRTAKGADTIFADQKAGIMPEWTWMEGAAKTAPSEVPVSGLGAFVPEDEIYP